MTVCEIAKKLELKQAGSAETDSPVTGCYIGDLLSLVMSRAQEGEIWLTVQTNINIIAVAVLVGLSCIIVTEGMEIPEETRAKADEQGIALFTTAQPTYQVAHALAALL